MAATSLGFLAILLWSVLALLTTGSGNVPPFQFTAICFAIATAIGIVAMRMRGVSASILRQPIAVWVLGVGGLFGYHFFYFTALRNAPPAQARLIAYLWPLLIVLFYALLPGERLRWFHLAGAMLGLAGVVLLVAPQLQGFETAARFGYAVAGLCAFIWSGYSVLSRRFADVPSDIVTGFCAVSAVLATLSHLAFEQTVWPDGALQWAATLALGLGPVGGAFYLWDAGVKHGNIQLLGAASYATPVLSVIVLVATGFAEADLTLALATLLVTGGAVLAAKDLLRR
ncbi:MAG: EamA family transporter [Pseudomonadota bacterium]